MMKIPYTSKFKVAFHSLQVSKFLYYASNIIIQPQKLSTLYSSLCIENTVYEESEILLINHEQEKQCEY